MLTSTALQRTERCIAVAQHSIESLLMLSATAADLTASLALDSRRRESQRHCCQAAVKPLQLLSELAKATRAYATRCWPTVCSQIDNEVETAVDATRASVLWECDLSESNWRTAENKQRACLRCPQNLSYRCYYLVSSCIWTQQKRASEMAGLVAYVLVEHGALQRSEVRML